MPATCPGHAACACQHRLRALQQPLASTPPTRRHVEGQRIGPADASRARGLCCRSHNAHTSQQQHCSRALPASQHPPAPPAHMHTDMLAAPHCPAPTTHARHRRQGPPAHTSVQGRCPRLQFCVTLAARARAVHTGSGPDGCTRSARAATHAHAHVHTHVHAHTRTYAHNHHCRTLRSSPSSLNGTG